MADDMFFSDDHRALRKGRRTHKRTPISRLVIFHLVDKPEEQFQGRVRNLSRDSALLDSPVFLPIESEVELDVQKDAKGIGGSLIQIRGVIARVERKGNSTFEFGVRLIAEELPEKGPPPRRPRPVPPPPPARKPSRMHIMDIIGKE